MGTEVRELVELYIDAMRKAREAEQAYRAAREEEKRYHDQLWHMVSEGKPAVVAAGGTVWVVHTSVNGVRIDEGVLA